MPLFVEKNMRYAQFAETCEKCGNKRNMRQSHIRIKLACLPGTPTAASPSLLRYESSPRQVRDGGTKCPDTGHGARQQFDASVTPVTDGSSSSSSSSSGGGAGRVGPSARASPIHYLTRRAGRSIQAARCEDYRPVRQRSSREYIGLQTI